MINVDHPELTLKAEHMREIYDRIVQYMGINQTTADLSELEAILGEATSCVKHLRQMREIVEQNTESENRFVFQRSRFNLILPKTEKKGLNDQCATEKQPLISPKAMQSSIYNLAQESRSIESKPPVSSPVLSSTPPPIAEVILRSSPPSISSQPASPPPSLSKIRISPILSQQPLRTEGSIFQLGNPTVRGSGRMRILGFLIDITFKMATTQKIYAVAKFALFDDSAMEAHIWQEGILTLCNMNTPALMSAFENPDLLNRSFLAAYAGRPFEVWVTIKQVEDNRYINVQQITALDWGHLYQYMNNLVST